MYYRSNEACSLEVTGHCWIVESIPLNQSFWSSDYGWNEVSLDQHLNCLSPFKQGEMNVSKNSNCVGAGLFCYQFHLKQSVKMNDLCAGRNLPLLREGCDVQVLPWKKLIEFGTSFPTNQFTMSPNEFLPNIFPVRQQIFFKRSLPCNLVWLCFYALCEWM